MVVFIKGHVIMDNYSNVYISIIDQGFEFHGISSG